MTKTTHTSTWGSIRRTAAACAVLLGAAAAVQAQPGMHGGPGMQGGPGMHGGAGMHGGPGMREPGMMGMAGPGRHLERMLSGAGASADQRAKVRDIMTAARDEVQRQHEAGRDARRQMAQLMLAPQVDAAAVESARQRMSAAHDAASKRMTQAMLDAGAVLTPEQRAKLADRMKARGEMMERHRREREALQPKG